MKRLLKRALFVAIAPALVSLASCVEQGTPLAVESALEGGPLMSQGSAGPDLSRLARFEQHPSITIAWAKKWIGPAGGRLQFQGFAVDVPAGAVDRVTKFSIRLPVDPKGSERVLAEFGPHGAVFSTPITIEFPLAGTSVEASASAQVVWWNGSEWVDMGGEITSDGERIATTTDHFSTYGTSDDSLMGGGVTASGG